VIWVLGFTVLQPGHGKRGKRVSGAAKPLRVTYTKDDMGMLNWQAVEKLKVAKRYRHAGALAFIIGGDCEYDCEYDCDCHGEFAIGYRHAQRDYNETIEAYKWNYPEG
jgi:hypothetical protein